MKLALFTPGAYIWPMHRSFESFIATLSVQMQNDCDVFSSPRYPVSGSIRSQAQTMSDAMSDRLSELHRELYQALLTSPEVFQNSKESISSRFWPDLIGTSLDDLMNALMYFFTRSSGSGVSISKGLAVFRGVFFNHEASEPEHWVHSSLERITPERVSMPEHFLTFSGPLKPVVDNLAFCILADRHRPPSSPGMLQGRLDRGADGRLTVTMSCGTDPHFEKQADDLAVAKLESELRKTVSRVFGWPTEVTV